LDGFVFELVVKRLNNFVVGSKSIKEKINYQIEN
jgi:hypothetical protein